jgi:hypothetical protein
MSTAPDSAWLAPHPGLGISMMDHLYNRMEGAYLDRWRRNFPDAQSIDNWRESWAEAFDEAGVVPAEVKDAIRLMRARFGWPPTIAEFLTLCKPSMDAQLAYHEAVAGLMERRAGRMGTWSSPAIFWAAQPLRGDLLLQTYEQVKVRWEKALNEQMTKGGHAPIPEPRLELPAPGKTTITREEAAKRLASLRVEGIFKRPGAGDGRLWAKRILERHVAGDKTVTPLQLREATLALQSAIDDSNHEPQPDQGESNEQ